MAGLTDEERFHFDLNGYVVVRGALSAAEVASLNRAVDANVGGAVERVGTELRNTEAGTPLAGDGASGRIDLAGMLGWEQPHCTGFRELLAHPNLVGKINDLCGEPGPPAHAHARRRAVGRGDACVCAWGGRGLGGDLGPAAARA